MGFITLGAGVPSLRPPKCSANSECTPSDAGQLAILYMGLGLFAVGSSCLRPCNIAFGVDQFDVSTEKGRSELESFCNWWYFLFTVALIVALTAVVYVQTKISWFYGFVIPTVCFFFSLVIFLKGKRFYILLKPKGSIISDLAKVIVAAIRKRHVDVMSDPTSLSFYDPRPVSTSGSDPEAASSSKLDHTNRFTFLDKAAVIISPTESHEPINDWRLCSLQQVEEFKAILSTLPVWVAGIICILSMQQTGSFGILQALQTNKSIGPKFTVPPAWMGLVPMVALSIWIFFYEKIYVPWTEKTAKFGRRLSVENRILIGVLFSIVTMVVSGVIEVHRRTMALKRGTFESPLTFWWLVPQFALSGLIEAFAAITLMELLTSQWPENMKTLGGAVFFLTLSIASYLNAIIIRVIKIATRNLRTPWLSGGNDLNKTKLEYYYYTIAVLAGLNLLYFVFFARHYLHSRELQESSQNEPDDG